jgi:uncharacterized protein (UPF0333 family)
MKKFLNQKGIASVLVIVIAAVVVVAGGAGYYVYTKQKDKNSSSTSSEIAEVVEAVCKTVDEDTCKFMSSWKENGYYTIAATTTEGGETTTMTMQIQDDNFHIITGDDAQYEAIKIGDTTYIKDFSDNAWWKQTISSDTEDSASTSYESTDLAFDEPSEDIPEAQRTVYKKIGKEACGDLTCFKYQVIDPTDTTTTNYIWFDDKDYQLRRMQTTSADGSVYDATFDYTAFTITEPSPTKEYNYEDYLTPTP